MPTSEIRIPDSPRGSYGAPPPGPPPRLYALLAVEVAPSKIVYYHLELDHHPGACTIQMDRDDDDYPTSADLLDPIRYTFAPWRINATISGTVVSDQPDYRPPARTDATVSRALPPGAAA